MCRKSKKHAMRKACGKKSRRVRDELRDCIAHTETLIVRKVDNARAAFRRDLGGGRNELTARIDAARADLAGRFDARHGELSLLRESITAAKIWALSLYIALATSLLAVIARGFHWL